MRKEHPGMTLEGLHALVANILAVLNVRDVTATELLDR
jgi:hypothetical protein